MITTGAIASQARAHGLALRGIVAPEPDQTVPDWAQSIVLFGPDEPAFWGIFCASPEYSDGQTDPLDRWSERIAHSLAKDWGGVVLLPSDGPPYLPFLKWAVQSKHAWSSPVGPLVHAEAGLFISYRFAIALPQHLETPAPAAKPCDSCAAPCTTNCPVGALGPDQIYDTASCKNYIASPEGADCLQNGCLVRRACPVATNFLRLPDQSAFHMAAFLKN